MLGTVIRSTQLKPSIPLFKADRNLPLFEAISSNQGIQIRAGSQVAVGERVFDFDTTTAVEVPTHAAGTDYAIWATLDGDLVSSTNFSSPPETGAIRIGGYHYAPGGNAPIPPPSYAGSTGGNSTPQINPQSIHDLCFRPRCPDPRGMTFFGTGWADIYPCAQNHLDGLTSKFNATVASGARPPRIPTFWGGDGSTNYPDGRWYFFSQVMSAYGKELPIQDNFMRAAYGSTPGRAVGSDPVTASLDAQTTSWCGMIRATGSWWQWGDGASFGGTSQPDNFVNRSNGLGAEFAGPRTLLLGGGWNASGDAGPAAAGRSGLSDASLVSYSARGFSAHINLA